ncbi:2-C-methyl-D-erythritol 2,4-cyclodiphosphate synthase [Oleiphilus sp. HI0123]|uniref:2-C-methyl-D-erythritol 2,4-cyclodiphosphate synthase n=2 Tax=unclassified Oleiphilus TaxID=2631174 RepID=UPI0007C3132C|nr:hypothetical protein A3761_03130 [Oleiphilus sp. HI0123]
MSVSSPSPSFTSSPLSGLDSAKQALPRFWVIIPAAGVGSRMQSDIPKQYLQLGSSSVLYLSAKAFLDHPRFTQVHIGISEADDYFDSDSLAQDARVIQYKGGSERFNTVLNGLDALVGIADEQDWVWVHDAARPCLSREDIDNLIEHVDAWDGSEGGAILASRVVDTIKVSQDGRAIEGTSDRDKLWRAFTPQVFRFAELRHALSECQRLGLTVTDESSAIEHMGGAPCLVEGSDDNIKITRPHDLRLAADTLAARTQLGRGEKMNSFPRIGNGYDVHAFCEGEEIILGGVKIPHHKSFIAHSDGDVLIHAIMDAMLGALALGDIGKRFPDTDEKWKGANSRELLSAVNHLISEKGFVVSNIDSVIIAQAPKMAPHIGKMQENIAQDLQVSPELVSVKATTTERLGFAGREEGVACQASVLLVPKPSCESERRSV